MVKSISWLKQAILTAERPTATLMIGIPGSGKSTWVREHLTDLAVFSTDDLVEAYASENGMSYSDAIHDQDVFRLLQWQMYEEMAKACDLGQHIIVDRTNVSKAARNKVLVKLPKTYLKFAAVFVVPREEIDRRLAKRVAETGKWIGPAVIDTMFESFEFPSKPEFDEVFV